MEDKRQQHGRAGILMRTATAAVDAALQVAALRTALAPLQVGWLQLVHLGERASTHRPAELRHVVRLLLRLAPRR
jgi:hypothetical protein